MAYIVAVLAGNCQEYADWLRDSGYTKKTARFIGSDRDARGIEFDRYEIVGTFWDRRDAREALENIQIRVIVRGSAHDHPGE